MEDLIFPKGIEKSKEMDLNLLPRENIKLITCMQPVSKLRSLVLCVLLAYQSFVLHDFFSQSLVTAESLFLPVGVSLVTYFMWHYRVTESGKKLVSNIIKYSIQIALLSYLVTFIGSLFSPFLQGLNIPSFSMNPIENINGILDYVTGLINTSVLQYSNHLKIVCLGIIGASLSAIPLIFMKAKGTLYYITNKRVIVRQKSGTVQVTTLPLDNLVEITAFQGFFGRLLGYGDVILTLTSGGGFSKSLKPKSVSPLGSFYEVRKRLEGIKEVWNTKDIIIKLREKYVQANYLANMEKELTRIREAVEEKKLKPKIAQIV